MRDENEPDDSENTTTMEPASDANAVEPEESARHLPGAKKSGYWWGTGRRKTSVARVRIREGGGLFLVNRKEFEEFFKNDHERIAAKAPLQVSQCVGKYDVFVSVNGGGPTGQSGAVRMGLARALMQADPTLENVLRGAGHMTRDSRMKERKKYGQKAARRRFQFSKR